MPRKKQPRAKSANTRAVKVRSDGGRSERERSETGRFAYQGLDRVMHEKARLGILASLAAHSDGLLFNDLKQLCSLTDGNLSRHLGVLTDAGFIEVWKATSGARQQTLYRLTLDGRTRFSEYINLLGCIVSDAQTGVASKSGSRSFPGEWSPAT